ncbi:hypothetical protein ACHAXA_001242 [Cyclostephanos tholiformis]|jgi:ethanolaminephosphotransferase|uniref:Uncharacterized protein n=1 Tax=Cyclostephanos tholiformis TaxID=382380 RepID=A0ABD3R6U9_9STRA
MPKDDSHETVVNRRNKAAVHRNDDYNGTGGSDDGSPRDETLTSCILLEPRTLTGNISPHGLHYIANHRYRPSEYTHLDNLLNPIWTYLTELLPLWLAPNTVTSIGGMHCGLAYALLWHHAPDFDEDPPDWVVFVAGYCILAYYTLDCMDGKQARRTNSSSPLGQLFDHGFDCICTLFFIATVGSYLMIGGTYWIVIFQTTLQLAFFMAQWEEYHTHVLPHCAGKWCGVTEVNYAMGVITIANSFLDRVAFYHRPMGVVLAPLLSDALPSRHLPAFVRELELRHFLLICWFVMSGILMMLSVKRVMIHPNIAGGGDMNSSTSPSLSRREIRDRRFNAMTKLVSPMALCAAAMIIPPDAIRTRYLSVALGLAFSILTKKMIVFSMAKMAYAVVQFDVVPLLLGSVWIRSDTRLTRAGADFVLGVLCFWYAFRLLRWINVTINQICERLDIYCFRLKKKI